MIEQINMEDDFNYQAVPFHFIHCLHPACPRSENCLRHLTALHIPQDVSAILTVSPSNYPKESEQCPYFRSTEKLRYAWGITTFFDHIPYKKALEMKRRFNELYPKTTYYRILHKERSLSPAEQTAIADLFTKSGITEAPVYDYYTQEYNWEDHPVLPTNITD